MNWLLSILPTAIPAVVKLFKGKTPDSGKKIRNFGLKTLAAGAAVFGADQAGLLVEPGLPEIPQSWIAMAEIILAIVGTICTLIGQSQTDEHPDDVCTGENCD